MLRVFNCGIGMILITPEPEKILAMLAEQGEPAFRIGSIAKAESPDAKPDLKMQVTPDFRAA